MKRTVSVKEAQKRFPDLIEGVRASGDEVVIERDGEPVAVVVPPRLYKSIERERDEFWETIQRVGARNRNIPPEQIEADIEAAIREYRAERRSRQSK